MVSPLEIEHYCNRELQVMQFDDYAPNGLQVDGGRDVSRLVTGVTASQALIDAAVKAEADTILVHHGYFWKGESPTLTGIKGRRIRTLMQQEISLLAYHLPLDAHPEMGNNRLLADVLGLVELQPPLLGKDMVWQGALLSALSGDELAELIEEKLARRPLHISGSRKKIKKVAWCSGGAQAYLPVAAMLGADAYISGEVSEQTYHQAIELGLHYYAAGHHATERMGVRALGNRLLEQFDIECIHVDIPNPA